ncbi:MAG: hypothetical protein A3F12_00760 [Gammaproteobacteria bacterium RIFCSPHIGHO2_12_FULL_38_14]|nr:MAG: hypothetical protein A3F12_00760 [Gammaproteobacteria bacterium RIFCSPHIGHO2_12_FULL_38_14]
MNSACIYIIGTGTMGRGIALWSLQCGYNVIVKTRSQESLGKFNTYAEKYFKHSKLNESEINSLAEKLQFDLDFSKISQADIVIECVKEDVLIKHQLYRQIEPLLRKTAILVSNTSSLTLEALNQPLSDKTRFLGIHFFNPVYKLQLVEVSVTSDSAAWAKQMAIKFIDRLKKHPIYVKSSSGFVVNRILIPYILAAIKIRESGISAELIDNTMLKGGMPMGPLQVADLVGLDVCLHIAKNLTELDNIAIPNLLVSMVTDNKCGKKNEIGFYNYSKVKISNDCDNSAADQVIFNRLAAVIRHQIARCLQDQVVENIDSINIALELGAGFPKKLCDVAEYSEYI